MTKFLDRSVVLAVLFVMVLVVSIAPNATVSTHAQNPAFGSIINVSSNSGFSWKPHIVAVGSNVYVVWEDYDYAAGNDDTLFAASSNNGVSFGSVINLSESPAYSEEYFSYPKIAAIGNNVYVVWQEDGKILFRASSDNGVSFGGKIQLSDDTGNSQPQIAAVGSDVYVVWRKNVLVNPTYNYWAGDIFFRASSDNGGTFDATINLSSNGGDSRDPQIAAIGTYVYVVWSDNTGGPFDVFFRASSDNGVNFGGVIQLSDDTNWSSNPKIATVESQVYVAWIEGPGPPDLLFRASSDNGGTFGSTTIIKADVGGDPPVIAATGSSVYVAFTDWSTGNAEVFFRASNNSGISFGSTINLSSNSGLSVAPDIAVSGSNVFVAWQDSTPGLTDVLFRASNNNGASFDTTINLSSASGNSNEPKIAVFGNNVYVVWSDNNPAISVSGSFDIFFIGGSIPIAPLPAGLVHWWSGDGNADDIIGGAHGTLQNGASFAPGKVGQAFSFDGTDDYVSVPLTSPTGAFTVDAWILETRGFALPSRGTIIEFGDDQPVIWVHYEGYLSVNLIPGGYPDRTVPVNEWTHVALTWDGSGITMKLYMNGELVESGFLVPRGGEGMRIGFGVTGLDAANNAWHGLIDEVRIFDRALTDSEIQAIYQAGQPPPPADTTPPTVSITSPSNGALLNTATLTVAGTADDASGIQKVEVSVDADAFQLATGTTSWSFNIPALSDGPHTITARATDNAANAADTSITVTVDTTPPPAPTLISPENGAFTNDPTPTFDWSDVTDPSGVVYTLQVATDSGFTSLVLNEEGLTASTSTPTTALAEGIYFWKVKSSDNAGNDPFSPTFTFTVDTTPPTVTGIAVSDTLITDADVAPSSFQVVVTFSETMDTAVTPTIAFTPAVSSTLTIASDTWSAGDSVYTATFNVADANVAVVGVDVSVSGAKDVAGNTQSPDPTATADLFDIDTENPTVTFSSVTAPADGFLPSQTLTSFPTTVGSTPITVSGTVTDNQASVLVNAVPVTVASDGSWTLTGVALNVGANTIAATATDTAGNTATASVEVTLNQDLDTDGIRNNVDTEPTVSSNDFSDEPLGGTTQGTITQRGDRTWLVQDEPDDTTTSTVNEGLRLIVGAGSQPAEVQGTGACTPATVVSIASTGANFVFSCGSTTVQVTGGSVNATVTVNAQTVTAAVDAGGGVSFNLPNPETLEISNIGETTVQLTTDGVSRTVNAGDETFVAPITKESFMTDSQFAQISNFETVFTPHKATSSLKLAATNPGTYFYNKIVENTGTSPLTVTIALHMPTSLNPSLNPAFCLKGSNPIHIYADLARTVDVTAQATISPSQPIANSNSQSVTCVSTASATFTIPAGELRYVTVHLDFAGKGSTGFTQDAPTTYVQGFKFRETITLEGIRGEIRDVTPFTGVGKKLNPAAIGGFALDTNLNYKSALHVRVLSGATVIGESPVTPPDGFYFVHPVPTGGPYTVQLFNPATGTIVKSTSIQSVAKDQYVQVDFLNLNPADPAIEGFVFDSSTQGVAGVTVELLDQNGNLMSSTETSASGWYAFRFAQPGTYTLKVIVPLGYMADETSETVSLKQFQEVRVDFNLK